MQSDNLFETVDTRHGRVTLFANDTGAISDSLRLYGEWAQNELSFMLSMVHPGDTVIDVGGYIGTHTLAFARHVGEHGHVVTIEAQARSFELLSRNIQDNGLTNVRAENAIASEVGKEEHIPAIDIETPASYGSASLRDVFVPGAGHQESSGAAEFWVKSIALDELPVASCALVKIDVEGMEDMVLRGAGELIRRHEPAIYAECNSLEDGLRCFRLLREYGYRVRAHVVLAFNEDNFLHCSRNVFMGAREVALVGTSEASDPLEGYSVRPCELLLDIETADDLALALLNKPQYDHEVLRASAAARSGGVAALDAAVALRESVRPAAEKEERIVRDLKEQHAQELDQRERKIAEMAEENSRLRAEVVQLRAEVVHATESERSAREASAELTRTVEQVRQSLSWRLTAPLRALSKKNTDR
ncbi:FkbM family methyltransferase [Paraburkholderia silvatlantica]|uniref:FkbM family methyltransferase n=1 Tax=Paraburkholderia silvatlantica TaxID=321895 RepID=A0ABR6FZ70_9BURK|nr:FkbM family methyltransferase [Paraburkholderia silvatlantica]MBB2932387.1 FkbM family methyltransferase [Paraburkholderia silvatlantica]PVY15993.1 FkbM family methyltransferase [Paraburkholderia silvatlantica]PXW23217.1 FkbM family methyltransferase [Paraburkholderia silvatlantica]